MRDVVACQCLSEIEDMITAAEAAKLMNVTRTRIFQLCRQGRIEGARKFGNAWLIPSPFKILPPRERKGLTSLSDVE